MNKILFAIPMILASSLLVSGLTPTVFSPCTTNADCVTGTNYTMCCATGTELVWNEDTQSFDSIPDESFCILNTWSGTDQTEPGGNDTYLGTCSVIPSPPAYTGCDTFFGCLPTGTECCGTLV